MKRARPDDGHRDAQAGSPMALLLIDLLADPTSALYSCLRVSDLLFVRLTCKEAWGRIHHKILTKNNLWKTAVNLGTHGTFEDMRAPHLPMLQWCMRQALELPERIAKCIGATGNMALIEMCVARYGRHVLVHLLAGAAGSGHAAPALNLFAQLGPDQLHLLRSDDVKECVSAGGLVEVAKLVYDTPGCLSYDDLAPALLNGHLHFVAWALSKSESALDSDEEDCTVALAGESGSMELVRRLVEVHGYPRTHAAVIAAATSGKLYMLRWLHERIGGDLQESVDNVARQGHLHVLEWLTDQGCQLTAQTLYAAAEASTPATVAWLLDRGCPHDEKALVERSCRNLWSGDTFQFLVETKGMQYNPEICRQLASSAVWLTETVLYPHGAPLSDTYFTNCVCSGDIERFRNAIELGAPFSKQVLRVILGRGECAMLCEALQHSTVNGKASDDFFTLLVKAVNFTGYVTRDTLQVLAQFGYVSQKGEPVSGEDVDGPYRALSAPV